MKKGTRPGHGGKTAAYFQEMASDLKELELLYQTSRSIATASDVDDVVAAYLEQVARGSSFACNVVIYRREEDEIRSRMLVASWLPAEGLQFHHAHMAYERDRLDDDLDLGVTIRVEDVRTDPRVPPVLRDWQESIGRLSLAFIPLMFANRREGLVVLSDEPPRGWADTDVWPYEVTAAQLIATIISRRDAASRREEQSRLAVFEERNRIARELHDSVTQMLFSLQLLAQSAPDAFRQAPEEGLARVDRMVDLSGRALTEMRALLSELRPEGTKRANPELAETLQSLARDLRVHGIELKLETSRYRRNSEAQEHTLTRVAQEAVSNALKHSGASEIVLEVTTRKDGVTMRVTDNGHGIQASREGGLGLSTMRERAEAGRGQIEVTSSAAGTVIELHLPPDVQG